MSSLRSISIYYLMSLVEQLPDDSQTVLQLRGQTVPLPHTTYHPHVLVSLLLLCNCCRGHRGHQLSLLQLFLGRYLLLNCIVFLVQFIRRQRWEGSDWRGGVRLPLHTLNHYTNFTSKIKQFLYNDT